MEDLGYIPVNGTVRFEWDTIDRTGAAITRATNGSIRIYKDHGTTERASSSGVTDTEDFDGVTGCHVLSIDLSDNTTASFYADGSQYAVMLHNATIDGVSGINRWLCKFRIGTAPANVTQVSGDSTAADNLELAYDGTGYVGGLIYPNVNVKRWDDTSVPSGGVAGVPIVDVRYLGGNDQSAEDLKDFADAGYDPATNKVQGVVLVDTATTLTNDPTGVGTLLTRLGTPSNLGSGATVAANLVDIESQTDDIGVAGAGLTEAGGTGDQFTAIPWNAAWDAEVQSEADDALVARGLDHLVNVAVAGADVADDSIVAKLASKGATADWDTFTNTTDALEALRDRGDAAWITATGFSTLSQADVRSAVGLGSANLDTQLDAIPTTTELNARTLASASYATAANLATANTGITAIQAVTDKLDDTLEDDGGAYRFTANALEEAPTDGSAPTAAAIADAVWDESTTGHTTAGTFGAQAKTVLDDVPTTAEFEARTLAAASYFDPATDTVLNVTTVGTLTGHTPQTGDSFAVVSSNDHGLAILKGLIEALPTASGIATAVWAAGTRTLTAISDSSGITTLLARLTSTRAGNLDNLDATVSSRSTHSAADVKTAMEATGSMLERLDNTLVSDGVFSEAALANAPTGDPAPTVEDIADELEASDRFGGKFLTMIELDGAEYRYTDNALEEGPGASLSGPYPLLVTVTDLATGDPIENARVRVYQSGVEESRDTNSSGQTQPALPALGTWGYAISAANHGSATGTVDIDGSPNPEALNVTLAQTTTITPPADPDLCLGYFTAIGSDGQPESGAVFYAKLVEGDGTAGYSLDTTTESATSAADGLVQFPGLLRGKRYVFWRGTSHCGAKPFTIPDQSTVAIPEFLGTP